MHSRSMRRPQTFSPSCILGDLHDDDEDGNMKPCALCGRGFPNRDIVMASCGCHHHPWCIATQTWNSDLCSDSACQEEFIASWRRSMGLHHIEGKLFLLVKICFRLQTPSMNLYTFKQVLNFSQFSISTELQVQIQQWSSSQIRLGHQSKEERAT